MELIKLSNRLQAIASFVPSGSNVADIGTDHGYIPVWLAQKQIANKIAAADINIGPLEHAKRTAAEYNVLDQIKFELCNGLNFSDCFDYDTIIIAGMGGELIASIIEAAPWTKNGCTLILQPNSKIQDLVEWLTNHEYEIIHTKLVKDSGKYYQILVVTAGTPSTITSESNRLVHDLYFKLHDPLLSEYIDSLLKRYRSVETGMLTAKKESSELYRIQTLISNLEQMKKEILTWQL